MTSNTVQSYGQDVGGLIGFAYNVFFSDCTVRDTVVVNLDDSMGVELQVSNRRHGFSGKKESKLRAFAFSGHVSRNPLRPNPFIDSSQANEADYEQIQNGANGQMYSYAGGIVGSAFYSIIINSHQFGFTNDPSAVVVSNSNGYAGTAGGVAGYLFCSKIIRSGVVRGAITATVLSAGKLP